MPGAPATLPAVKTTATPDPLYMQVYRIIVDRILSGGIQPGGKLPAEAELARQTGVSLGTLRHAVDMLVADGVLNRRPGLGTFVQTYRHAGYRNRFQPFESIDGKSRFDVRRLVCFEKTTPTAEAADALRLAQGQQAVRMVRHMVRVRPEGETVTAIDEIFLSPVYFSKMTEALYLTRFRRDDSLYKFYDRECGIVIVSQKCDVTCQRVAGDLARRLHAPRDMDALRLVRVSLTFGRTPVEFRDYRARAEEARLVFDL